MGPADKAGSGRFSDRPGACCRPKEHPKNQAALRSGLLVRVGFLLVFLGLGLLLFLLAFGFRLLFLGLGDLLFLLRLAFLVVLLGVVLLVVYLGVGFLFALLGLGLLVVLFLFVGLGVGFLLVLGRDDELEAADNLNVGQGFLQPRDPGVGHFGLPHVQVLELLHAFEMNQP